MILKITIFMSIGEFCKDKDLAYKTLSPALQCGDAVCISFNRSLTTIVAEVVVGLLLLL